MKLAVLIPAYNEQKTLERVIRSVPKTFPGVTRREIIVVDDGSSDETAQIAKKMKVTLISHWLNRGLGGALGTGFRYAKLHNFDALVTFDADGQHDYKDLLPVVKPIIEKQADVVIGSRLKKPDGMPLIRRIGNWGLNVLTFLFFQTWTTDSQSGLRAFSKKAIQEIKLLSNRMEVSSEFFNEISRLQLKFVEVPIRSIYTKYSLEKGQKNSNGFNILFKIIVRRLFIK